MQAMCDSSSPAEGPPLDRRARRGQVDGCVTEKAGREVAEQEVGGQKGASEVSEVR